MLVLAHITDYVLFGPVVLVMSWVVGDAAVEKWRGRNARGAEAPRSSTDPLH